MDFTLFDKMMTESESSAEKKSKTSCDVESESIQLCEESCPHTTTANEGNVILCITCGEELTKRLVYGKEYSFNSIKYVADPMRVVH